MRGEEEEEVKKKDEVRRMYEVLKMGVEGFTYVCLYEDLNVRVLKYELRLRGPDGVRGVRIAGRAIYKGHLYHIIVKVMKHSESE